MINTYNTLNTGKTPARTAVWGSLAPKGSLGAKFGSFNIHSSIKQCYPN